MIRTYSSPPSFGHAVQKMPLWLFVFCFLALGLSPAQGKTTGPLAALVMAQEGVDTANADLFYQAIPLDGVLQNAVADLRPMMQQQAEMLRKSGKSESWMQFIGKNGLDDSPQGELVRQLLISQAKSFVTAGINGGYFSGNPQGRGTGSAGAFGFLLEQMTTGRKEIVPGKILSEKGATATVSATLVDHGEGSFPLVLELKKEGGHWYVTRVANLAALVREAMEHAR